jgi:hypothetical protein
MIFVDYHFQLHQTPENTENILRPTNGALNDFYFLNPAKGNEKKRNFLLIFVLFALSYF